MRDFHCHYKRLILAATLNHFCRGGHKSANKPKETLLLLFLICAAVQNLPLPEHGGKQQASGLFGKQKANLLDVTFFSLQSHDLEDGREKILCSFH